MKEYPTENLLRIIEASLIEWRRLPVKHAQQIATRTNVVNAFTELGRRLVEYEDTIARLRGTYDAAMVKEFMEKVVGLGEEYTRMLSESGKKE